MRRVKTPIIAGLLSAAATCLCAAQTPAAAAQVPAKSASAMPQMTVLPEVHLDGPADLEHLRMTNFYHYVRAKKIIAAANEICRPESARTYRARFKAANVQCAGMMWMTSFPPKKLLTFRLDNVHYVALVTVTNLTGKLLPVHDVKR